tara:strand:- start:192 stop:443 length:252 start_codon:yes stop_codon:yes gene_type:complete
MKYIIYAKEDCPFCDKLLEFMKKNNKRFIYLVLYNLEDELNEIKERYDWETIPMVVELEGDNDQGKFIGGCEDTIEYLKRGDS